MPEEELDAGGSVDTDDETKYDEVRRAWVLLPCLAHNRLAAYRTGTPSLPGRQ